jgi:SAM-dependent methyltransferase
MTSYVNELKKQLANSEKPGIQEFMKHLYHRIHAEVKDCIDILEIGSGAGISKMHLTTLNILRTDIFEFPLNDVRGGIDSHRLPFENGSFDSCIAIDVLHHLANPLIALTELKRVTEFDKSGKIVLIEPYVSAFSYPVYKLFHSEKTSNPWLKKYSEPFISEKPEDGDQSLSKMLFRSEKGRTSILSLFPAHEFKIDLKIFSIFSFFVTGGLSKPFPVPRKLVKSLLKIESATPQSIMRILGSRCIIVIEKINE